jgi:hypothetical protein
LVAGVLAFELPLQTRDQVAVAVKIGERLTGSGAVDYLASVIFQGVVERDDGVFLDAHSIGPMWCPSGMIGRRG